MLHTSSEIAEKIEEYRRDIAEIDYLSAMEAAENKGFERGLAQARNLQKFEIAKILKNSNIDIAVIAKSTGLSESEIQRL